MIEKNWSFLKKTFFDESTGSILSSLLQHDTWFFFDFADQQIVEIFYQFIY